MARQLSAAHQPDVLGFWSLLPGKPLARRLANQRYASALAGLLLLRKNVALQPISVEAVAAAHLQSHFIRLAAHYSRINTLEKRAHRVVFRHEQEINRTIRPCNVPV